MTIIVDQHCPYSKCADNYHSALDDPLDFEFLLLLLTIILQRLTMECDVMLEIG